MAIHKISDFDPDYREHFDDRVKDIKGLDLYVNDDKVGSVNDILVDDRGEIRYLIINTGNWLVGKHVLLPIGFARIDYNADRVYAKNLTKSQVEALPEFKDDMTVDYDHEERVRGVYRGMGTTPQDISTGAGLGVATSSMADPEAMLPVETGYADAEVGMVNANNTANNYQYDRDTYNYDREPNLYGMDEENHPNLKLYSERLIANKERQKTGEAVISKRIETETAQASIPITKERIEVERMPASTTTPVAPGDGAFQAGEVSRVEIYEEVPEFSKETYVREEVRVNKVVETETATASERIRREEVDVNIDTDRPPTTDRTP